MISLIQLTGRLLIILKFFFNFLCYAVRYLVPISTGNWARYVDKIKLQVQTRVDQYRLLRVLPNRLTPIYSKNYYEEENYLIVKTVCLNI